MNIGAYSKAIGAAVGTAGSGAVIGGLLALPADTPWYGYLIGYTIAGILPIVATYFAPANTPV